MMNCTTRRPITLVSRFEVLMLGLDGAFMTLMLLPDNGCSA